MTLTNPLTLRSVSFVWDEVQAAAAADSSLVLLDHAAAHDLAERVEVVQSDAIRTAWPQTRGFEVTALDSPADGRGWQ